MRRKRAGRRAAAAAKLTSTGVLGAPLSEILDSLDAGVPVWSRLWSRFRAKIFAGFRRLPSRRRQNIRCRGGRRKPTVAGQSFTRLHTESLEKRLALSVTNTVRDLSAPEGTAIIETVQDWLGAAWDDTAGVGLGGIAIRSANATGGDRWWGEWKWSSDDGATWNDVQSSYEGGTKGLVLKADDLLRFRPRGIGTSLDWSEGFVARKDIRYWAFDGIAAGGLASGDVVASPGDDHWFGSGGFTYTFSAEITPVNDQPVFGQLANVVKAENFMLSTGTVPSYQLQILDAALSDDQDRFDPTPGNYNPTTITSASIDYEGVSYTVPIQDSLRLNGFIPGGFQIQPFGAATISTGGLFQYESPLHWSGSITVNVTTNYDETRSFDFTVEPVNNSPYVIDAEKNVTLTANEGETIVFKVNELFPAAFSDNLDGPNAAAFGGVFVRGTRYTAANGQSTVVTGYGSDYLLEQSTDGGITWSDLQEVVNGDSSQGVFVDKDAWLRIRPRFSHLNTEEYPNDYNYASFRFELYEDTPEKLLTARPPFGFEYDRAIDPPAAFGIEPAAFDPVVTVNYSFTPVHTPAFPDPEITATVDEGGVLYAVFDRYVGRLSSIDGQTNPSAWRFAGDAEYENVVWSKEAVFDGNKNDNVWFVTSNSKSVYINGVHVADLRWSFYDRVTSTSTDVPIDELLAAGEDFSRLEVMWTDAGVDFNGPLPTIEFQSENNVHGEVRSATASINVTPINDSPVIAEVHASYSLPVGDISQDIVSPDGALVSDVFRDVFNDSRDDSAGGVGTSANSLMAILITNLNNVLGEGEWQVKVPGGAWEKIGGNLTYGGRIDINDLLTDPGVWIRADARLRFDPGTTGWLGQANPMVVQLLDDGGARFSSVATGDTYRYEDDYTTGGYVRFTGGGSSGLSAGTVTIGGVDDEGNTRRINTVDQVSAVDDFYTGPEDGTVVITWGDGVLGVLDNDPDFDANAFDPALRQGRPLVVSYQIDGYPDVYNPSVTANIAGVGSYLLSEWGAGNFRPVQNFVGTAPALTYTLSNGASAKVYFTVENVNDPATGTVEITGIPGVGSVLRAVHSLADIDGMDSAVFAYQWYRGDSPIADATEVTYLATSDDLGAALSVEVTFTDDNGSVESVLSGVTDAVGQYTEFQYELDEDSVLGASAGYSVPELWALTGETFGTINTLEFDFVDITDEKGRWYYSNNDGVSWALLTQEAFLEHSSLNRVAFLPAPNAFGDLAVSLGFRLARDNVAGNDLYGLRTTILPVQDAPIPSGVSQTIVFQAGNTAADFAGFVLPEFTDPDELPVNYSVSGLPDWLSFDDATLQVTVTDGSAVPLVTEPIEFTITATDSIVDSPSASQVHRIVVQDGPQPALDVLVSESIFSTQTVTGDVITTLVAVDYASDTHTYTVDPDGDGQYFTTDGDKLVWQSADSPAPSRTYLVNVTATDNQGKESTHTVSLSAWPEGYTGVVNEVTPSLALVEDQLLILSQTSGVTTEELFALTGEGLEGSPANQVMVSFPFVNDDDPLGEWYLSKNFGNDWEKLELEAGGKFWAKSQYRIAFLPSANGYGETREPLVFHVWRNNYDQDSDVHGVHAVVSPVPDAPVPDGVSQTVVIPDGATADTFAAVTLPGFTDVDGNPLLVTASSLPSWLTFDETTFELRITEGLSAPTTLTLIDFVITVGDAGDDFTASQQHRIMVEGPQQPPVAIQLSDFVVPTVSVAGDVVGSLSAIDNPSDTHTFELVEDGDSALFAIVGNELQWNGAGAPTAEQTYRVTITATDNHGAATTQTFVLAGQIADNVRPVIEGTSLTPEEWDLTYEVMLDRPYDWAAVATESSNIRVKVRLGVSTGEVLTWEMMLQSPTQSDADAGRLRFTVGSPGGLRSAWVADDAFYSTEAGNLDLIRDADGNVADLQRGNSSAGWSQAGGSPELRLKIGEAANIRLSGVPEYWGSDLTPQLYTYQDSASQRDDLVASAPQVTVVWQAEKNADGNLPLYGLDGLPTGGVQAPSQFNDPEFVGSNFYPGQESDYKAKFFPDIVRHYDPDSNETLGYYVPVVVPVVAGSDYNDIWFRKFDITKVDQTAPTLDVALDDPDAVLPGFYRYVLFQQEEGATFPTPVAGTQVFAEAANEDVPGNVLVAPIPSVPFDQTFLKSVSNFYPDQPSQSRVRQGDSYFRQVGIRRWARYSKTESVSAGNGLEPSAITTESEIRVLSTRFVVGEGNFEASQPLRLFLAERNFVVGQTPGPLLELQFIGDGDSKTHRFLTVDGIRPELSADNLVVTGVPVVDLDKVVPGRVNLTFPLSEDVQVSGAPKLTLSNGGVAVFSHVSQLSDGTSTITFTYAPSYGADESASDNLKVEGLEADSQGLITDLYGNALVFQADEPLATGITVVVPNGPPAITLSAGDSSSVSLVAEGQSLVASGTVTVADPDTQDTVTWAVSAVSVDGLEQSLIPAALTENDKAVLRSFVTLTDGVLIDSQTVSAPAQWAFDSGSETFAFLDGDETLVLTYTLTATDSAGGTGELDLVISVTGDYDPPVLANPQADPSSATEDAPFSYTVPAETFADADATAALALTAELSDGSPLPQWLSFDPATRTLSGTPTNDDVGAYEIAIIASDGRDSVTDTVRVVVDNTNDAPVVASEFPVSATAYEDSPFTYSVPSDAFQDPDVGDTLTLSATLSDGSPLPSWLTFDAENRVLSGTPAQADVGALVIHVVANDGEASVVGVLTLTTVGVSDAPTGTDTTLTVLEDTSHTFAAADFGFADAADSPANMLVSVTITTLPTGGTLALSDSAVAAGDVIAAADLVNLVYTPAENATGIAYDSFTFQVKDDGGTENGGVDLAPTANTITFNVTPQNDPPVAPSQDNVAATAGESVNVTVPAFTDIDFSDTQSNESLTYAATLADGSVLPPWLSFDAASRTFTGVPPVGAPANLTVTVTATDSAGATASLTFDLVETDLSAPDAPLVTIDPAYDSGVAGDSITNVTQPVFTVAVTEAALAVIVYQVSPTGELVDVTSMFTSTLVNGELVYSLATGVDPLVDATYRVYVRDNAGNESTDYDTFRIDTTPPEVVRLDNSERSSQKVAGTVVPYSGDLLAPTAPVLKVDLSEPNLAINPDHLLPGAPAVFAELRDMNGNLLRYSDGSPIVFDITNINDLEIDGQFVSLKLREPLAFETRYQLVIPEGAFVDPADNGSIVNTTARSTFVFDTEPYDIDGIDYSVEDASGAANGDLNADGIPDKLQTNVSALPWVRQEDFLAGVGADPNTFIALQAGNVTGLGQQDRQLDDLIQIADVSVIKTNDPFFNGVAFPEAIVVGGGSAKVTPLYDPIKFTLKSVRVSASEITADNAEGRYFDDLDPGRPGTQVRAFIDLPAGGLVADVYLKWNPALNSGVGGWFAFNADGDLSTFDDGAEFIDVDGDGVADRIVLTFTDGSREGGDADGIVNGEIADPGVPGRTLRITGVNGSRSDDSSTIVVRQGVVPVHTFVAAGYSVAWSLGGPDASHFVIDAEGKLSFTGAGAPPVDAPTDIDQDNHYVVEIRAVELSDPSNTTTHTLTVQVTDQNNVPVITVGGDDTDSAAATVSTDALVASGTLSVEDGDRFDTVTVSVEGVTVGGVSDGLQATDAELLALFEVDQPSTVIDAASTSGVIHWSFNTPKSMVAYLADGEELALSFTIRVTDPVPTFDEHVVTIRFVGVNDGPEIASVQRAYTDTVAADRFVPLTGTITANDPEGDLIRGWSIAEGQTALGIVSKIGRYGRLLVNASNGDYVYEPDAMKINAIISDVVDEFDVTVSDGRVVSGGQFRVEIEAAVDTPLIYSVSDDLGTSPLDKLTSDVTLTVTGIGDPRATVRFFEHGDDGTAPATEIGSTTVAAGGSFTIVGSPLSEGEHFLSVISDVNGMQSDRVLLGVWEIDQTVPLVPVVDSTSGQEGIFSGTAEPFSTVTVMFSGNADFVGGAYTTTADAGGLWAIDTTTSPVVSGEALPASGGVFTATATVTDRAGNVSAPTSPAQFSIASPETMVTIASLGVTADSTPPLSGTGPEGQAVWVYVDDVLVGTTSVTSDGDWYFPTTDTLADGSHQVRVVLVQDGVQRASATQELIIDSAIPADPTITSPQLVNTSVPTLTGTAPRGTMVTLTIVKVGDTPTTTYRTNATNDGTWSIELGRTTPVAGVRKVLADGDYDLEAFTTSQTGVASGVTTIRLSVDTLAPESPVFTTPSETDDTTPLLTGSAEPNSLVRVLVDDAVFETVAGPDGTWTIDTGSATTVSGTRVTFEEAVYELWAEAVDDAKNVSTLTSGVLRVGSQAADPEPEVLALRPSFGDILSQSETALDASVFAMFAGVEDDQTAELTVAGKNYSATVSGGLVRFTIPRADLATWPQGNAGLSVEATNIAGVGTGQFDTPFLVDTQGPSRPEFVSITSTIYDPTPTDRFTGVVQPTVVIDGESGQTPVVRGPQGRVPESSYAATEGPEGRYTIQFLAPQSQGTYVVNLRDEYGNENSNGVGEAAQNVFRIDSVPILYDQTAKRQTVAGRVYGNLGVMNTLDGRVFVVSPNADGTWTDLDGERLMMGIVGGAEQMVGGQLVSMNINVNGATLSVNVDTGAYIYRPLPGTSRVDRFPLFLRDESGNETQVVLSFDAEDYLDRDGIGSITETAVAGGTGDRNDDGIADEKQNSVTSLAWGTESDFATAVNPDTANAFNPLAAATIVVNTTPFQKPNGDTVGSLEELMLDVDSLAQLLDISVVEPSAVTSIDPNSEEFARTEWDTMRYAIESLTSLGLTDLMPWREGKQIQVAIDVSAAGISAAGGPDDGLLFESVRKFVSQSTVDAYASVGVDLLALDGSPITSEGWYDFTALDLDDDGIYDTDGVIFADFQSPGQPGYGTIDALVVVLTDNAFGDDDPTLERIVDPILPGNSKTGPALDDVTISYVDTPMYERFDVRSGRLEAATPNSSPLSFGLVGGQRDGQFVTAANYLGVLRLNTDTGEYVFTPKIGAMNNVVTYGPEARDHLSGPSDRLEPMARGDALTSFVTTVTDGEQTTTAAVRVQVGSEVVGGITGDFLLGTLAPTDQNNIITYLSTYEPGTPGPTVPQEQEYIQFTLYGLAAEIQKSDLELYANGRLISLRSARLVRIGEDSVLGSITYRLLGINHLSSARSRYFFRIGGAGGSIATTWDRR